MWESRRFISIEGIDGTGKTELVSILVDELIDQGLNAHSVTDPPSFPPWTEIKKDILDRENEISYIAEAWIFLTARLDGIQKEILPALVDDAFVIADRYVDSWVAYNAPRLAGHFGSLLKAVRFLQAVHTALAEARLLVSPHRTWFLRDRPEAAMKRLKNVKSKWEKISTQRRVAQTYELILRETPRRFRTVNIRGRPLKQVRAQLVRQVVRYCLDVVATGT